MKTANFLLCLVAVAISSVIGSPVNDGYGRIANGMAIPIKEAPYMVRVINHARNSYCGGTLISPKYVVTAAHCVQGRSWNRITVVANVTSSYEYGIRRAVPIVSIHPRYNNETKHHDIALLLLNHPIDMPILPLCEKPVKEGNEVEVHGWGRLGEDMPRSIDLQTVFFNVTSKEECDHAFDHRVKEDMFCASGLEQKSTCKGDSGAPAVFNGQLCGVAGFQYKRKVDGWITAYTDVYKVKPFIDNMMRHLSNARYRALILDLYEKKYKSRGQP